MAYFADKMRAQLKNGKIVNAISVPYEIDNDYGWIEDEETGKYIFNVEGSLIEADGKYYWFWIDKEDTIDIHDNHIDTLTQFGSKVRFNDAIIHFTKDIYYKEK